MAEDNGKRAMADAARLAEELRHEQEHAGQIERLRRALESQVTHTDRPRYSVSSTAIVRIYRYRGDMA